MLRNNSRLKIKLGESGVNFLQFGADAFKRLLPHVAISPWKEGPGEKPCSVWTSAQRTAVRITLTVGEGSDDSRSLSAVLTRRRVHAVGGNAKQTIDTREHDICRLIAERLSEVLTRRPLNASDASIQAISDAFDEYVVASHIRGHHKVQTSVGVILDSLHKLAEQSYENKALTFGCIIDPRRFGQPEGAQFPTEFLRSKKYKALSDGFRTSYLVSTDGRVLDFVDLERFKRNPVTKTHFFPDWAEPLACASRRGRCGIGLSRQGDILVFDEGTLRFTYRYGRWQYWNHTHLVMLLRDRARAQRVPIRILGRVVGAIYRAALDVSFRRCGGLFVILHNRDNLRKIVKMGDAIGDQRRGMTDAEFDSVLRKHTIQALPRPVIVELASLDGAVVLDNSGHIRAYGAVLQPKKSGKLRSTEGSRTKAAIGASNYGLAIKISSDGDISVYYKGREFIRV